MPKILRVREDVTIEELYEKYRRSENGISKLHWQMVWLKAKGTPTKEIAKATGFNPDWIRRVVRRYNAMGEEGIGDRRRNNGTNIMLSAQQLLELRQALTQRAPDGGLWNSRKVALWIAEKVGHKIYAQTGWEYLQREKMSLQVPRPKHPETTLEIISDFKKKFSRSCCPSEQPMPTLNFGQKMRLD